VIYPYLLYRRHILGKGWKQIVGLPRGSSRPHDWPSLFTPVIPLAWSVSDGSGSPGFSPRTSGQREKKSGEALIGSEPEAEAGWPCLIGRLVNWTHGGYMLAGKLRSVSCPPLRKEADNKETIANLLMDCQKGEISSPLDRAALKRRQKW
jgi:hypothetical protein